MAHKSQPVALADIFGRAKPVVGMVHALPLPGSPQYCGSMDAVLSRARQDAVALSGGGVQGIIVENYGDVPFYAGRVPPETVAALALIVSEVRGCVALPVGVNVLRNDARSAVALAGVTGAAFVRVNVHVGTMWTDQGRIRGRAQETLRVRTSLAPGVAILADVFVKHAVPPQGLTMEDAARDTWTRGLADGVIISGSGTGEQTSLEHVERVRAAIPNAPVWIGSGLTETTAGEFAAACDGMIVGSALQEDGVAGNAVDAERVRAFMDQVAQP